MAVLNPVLMPTVGSPSVIVLPYRGKNMTQDDFYKQQKDAGSPVDQNIRPQQDEFTNKPMTGDLIKAQLQQYAQRAAPPSLEPSARVKNPDTSQTLPDNFKSYYDMLGSITDFGRQATAAETARAAFRRQQELNAIANQPVGGGGGGGSLQAGGGGSYQGGIPSNPAANFKFAQQIAPNYGWNDNELAAWYKLGMKESGWRNTAQNPTSTAYGIGQFLDSTWGGYGIGKTSDPALQVEAMARYIRARYGTPSAALAFHNAHNWY